MTGRDHDPAHLRAMLEAAKSAALLGGEVLARARREGQVLAVEQKAEFDFVTQIDRASEAAILAHLGKDYPLMGRLAEESGEKLGTSEYHWVIDPLDGTTNFIEGLPCFAVSIAAVHGETPVVGVIHDPLRQETFSAASGLGAEVNGTPIAVHKAQQLGGALLATGFPFRHPEKLATYLKSFEALFRRCRGVRRMGSAAIDLAYVASGRFGGFWELGLSRWDIAAGVVLVREAGGVVSGFGESTDFWNSGDVLAANPALHPEMRQILDRFFS